MMKLSWATLTAFDGRGYPYHETLQELRESRETHANAEGVA